MATVTAAVPEYASRTLPNGMTVAAYNEDGSRRGFTMTGSAGSYTLVLPPGTYRVAAYDETAVYAVQFFRDRNSFETADRITITLSDGRRLRVYASAETHTWVQKATDIGGLGTTAVRWTLVAMALLVLAFFGSKFVLELVLGYGV